MDLDDYCTRAGIVIAFPQRGTHLDTLNPLEIKLVDRQQGQ